MEKSMKTALVLGATGALGGAVADALLARGWTVRGIARTPQTRKGVEWIVGDAMNAAAVATAAHGVDVIFHGANPRRYANWRGLALPMLENTIAAAKSSGARLIFPGNVYNFGPDAWPVLREDSPQHPRTRKGRVRVEMEERLRAAAGQGVRTLILRAGDFFGPGYADSWLGEVIMKGGRDATAVVTLGRDDAGHAWAFLPDLAGTFALLAEREGDLPAFARFHFAGHYFGDVDEFIATLRAAAGNPGLKRKRFFWPMVYAAAPFVGFFREILEMRYLWNETIRLDNAALVAAIGEEPHTPAVEAFAAALHRTG